NKFNWFDKDTFTDAMIEKYAAGGLKSVTEFRVVKQHISNSLKVNKTAILSKRLREFADDPELRVEHLEIEGASVGVLVRTMRRDIGKLRRTVSEIDVEQFYGEDEFWDELEQFSAVIQKKLKEVGRRSKQ